jgi:polysaccharide biosynthesis transport protein
MILAPVLNSQNCGKTTLEQMELRYFLSVLSKRKWLLLLTMLIASGVTYFLVNKLPKKYLSSSVIETGIMTYKTIQVDKADPFVQEFEIEAKFSNLIEYMKSRQAIKALTKKLMQHDLRPDSSDAPFRVVKVDNLNITPEQIQNYLTSLETKPDSASLANPDFQNLATERTLEKAYGYDYETLFGKLDLKRHAKTDYVKLDYTSEDPRLSYFVVKNFVNEFLNFFYNRKKLVPNSSSDFYFKLVGEKKRVLDSLSNQKANYSKVNSLVDPAEESQQIVAQIKELEATRDDEQKKYEGSKKSYTVYSTEKKHIKDFVTDDYASNIAIKNEIIDLDKQRSKLRILEVDTKDPLQKKRIKERFEEIDTKMKSLTYQLAISRRDASDPAIEKNNEIYSKSVDAESTMEASGAAVTSLNKRIKELYGKKDRLVGNNADLERLDRQLKVAEEEYKVAVSGQYQADVNKQSSFSEQPMKVIETAFPPTKPTANNAILLSAFAGVGTGTVAVVLLFLLSYFDRSLTSPFQFTKLVNLPMLGVVNNLNERQVINFDYLYADGSEENKDNEYFKEALRKVRHEIESSGSKSFLFVSLKEHEGKSFMAAALAHSLSMKNQKVLIIDTNFKNNTLSGLTLNELEPISTLNTTQNGMQVYQNKGSRLSIDINVPSVSIIGNKGGQNSPSELLAGINFRKKVYDLGKNYDFVFLEAACLNKYSDARELVDTVEKVIPVFDATTSVSQIDEDNIAFLKTLGNRVLGCVLNKANVKAFA